MPTIKLINKDSEEISKTTFASTGSPLPRQVEKDGKKYQYELREGEVYVYKEFNS